MALRLMRCERTDDSQPFVQGNHYIFKIEPGKTYHDESVVVVYSPGCNPIIPVERAQRMLRDGYDEDLSKHPLQRVTELPLQQVITYFSALAGEVPE